MKTVQGQMNIGKLGIVVRPIGDMEPGKVRNTLADHEICVSFPCGQEVVVNHGVEYSLCCFLSNSSVISWACELLFGHNDCTLLRAMQRIGQKI